MKKQMNRVTKKPKNGVTKVKKVKKNINGVAFKRSKLSKSKRLNAISFKDVTRFWLLTSFWLPFWLPIKCLIYNYLCCKVTKVTKIISKTNLSKYIEVTRRNAKKRTRVYSPLYSFVGFLVTLVTFRCKPL